MFTVWLIFHIIVSIGLILVVLMQSSKGEGLAGSAFGGGSGLSGAMFGGRGAASFLSKATTVLAILFMFNCGALAFMSAGTRPIVGAPGAAEEAPSTSVVTEQAQRERDQALQMQQQQAQQQAADSAAGESPLDIKIIDQNVQTEGSSEQPQSGSDEGQTGGGN